MFVNIPANIFHFMERYYCSATAILLFGYSDISCAGDTTVARMPYNCVQCSIIILFGYSDFSIRRRHYCRKNAVQLRSMLQYILLSKTVVKLHYLLHFRSILSQFKLPPKCVALFSAASNAVMRHFCDILNMQ